MTVEGVAIINGRIYKSFKPKETVSALVSVNGRIIYTGDNDKALKIAEAINADVIDLNGKVVLPGFIDSHVHLDELGIYLNSLDLRGVKSIDDLKRRLRKFADKTKMDWIIGYGWDQELLKRYPTRWDLDEVVDDRPILLSRFCLHAGVLNTKDMEICYLLDSESPYVMRNEKGATGVVVEDAYTVAVNKFKESLRPEDYEKFIESAVKYVLSHGITAVGFVSCNGKSFRALEMLRAKGKLKLRVFVYLKDLDIIKLGGK